MTDLSAQERAFLDVASQGDDPSSEAKDRMRANLFAQLGVGAAAAGATAAAAGTAKAAAGTSPAKAAAAAATAAAVTTKTSLLTKALAGLAVVVVTGATGYAVTVDPPSSEPAHVALGAPAERGAAAARQQAATEGESAVALGEDQVDSLEDDEGFHEASPTPSPIPERPPAAVAARPRTPSSSATAPGLSDELGLLRSAQEKLQKGDAAEALEMLDDHERDHARGNLEEERMAVRVFALCEMGRKAEARATASRFLHRFPSSPLAPRVAKACLGDAP